MPSAHDARQKKVVVGKICRAFRLEGLTISKAAALGLESQLRAEPEHGKLRALRIVIEKLKERIDRLNPATGNLVTVENVLAVVADLTKDDEDRAQESLQVFNAFQLPKLRWNQSRKDFFMVSAENGNRLHGTAEDKIRMCRDRLELIRQRVMRHPLFSASSIGSTKRDFVQLTPIESVKSSLGAKCMLGFLSQLEEGQYFLEDLNSHIKLDLSNCVPHGGLFTERCVVLVEGEITSDGDVFSVHSMGFPPPESREQTLRHIRFYN